jgi:hypothetical protein
MADLCCSEEHRLQWEKRVLALEKLAFGKSRLPQKIYNRVKRGTGAISNRAVFYLQGN